MMSNKLPFLALDGILCDRPQDGCTISVKRNYARNNTHKETTEMTKTMLSSDAAFRDRCERNAQQVRRKHGLATDTAAMDDETIEKLKGFLKNKLSAEDHETLCNMLDGDSEAPDDVEAKHGMDGLDDFYARFPDAARIRIDNSGIQSRGRAASHSDAAGAKSFYDMFPDAARIKLA
jgi:hypothetical protein